MTHPSIRAAGRCTRAKLLARNFCCAFAAIAPCVYAAQIDIAGPAGSVAFGTTVTALPNGNVVVTDPFASGGAGAVHMYSPSGTLISTLSGSAAQDKIGEGGIVLLGNGHFVIMSPSWANGAALNAGAVTWVNGNTGLAGVVSPANSLVGSSRDDGIGSVGGFGIPGVVALVNGHYVVASSNWNNGNTPLAGAVTWANGNTGRTGAVSTANSLVGSGAEDKIGFNGVVPLTNGNYVVRSMLWKNGATEGAGAVTWGNGTTGVVGPVSPGNSLVGTVFNNAVGAGTVAALSNGHYVVASPVWSSATVFQAGAVTWGNGSTGRTGSVSLANSLVGTTPGDQVGREGITALTNGNYVVRSTQWDGAAGTNVGAVTWGNGTAGLVGAVSAANSLVGTTSDDGVGSDVFVNNRSEPGVVPLANGHYVVVSSGWDNGATADVGAVTWANGSTGRAGPVAPGNSLIGTTAVDIVGGFGVTALGNGHYVIASGSWDNGSAVNVGAVTWANGATGLTGTVGTNNSLVGAVALDNVGGNGIVALVNSNYVVLSPAWDNGATANVGAVTWVNGAASATGVVSVSNSLVGTAEFDSVGNGDFAALSNGHYVVASHAWDNGTLVDAGAVTWGNGDTGRVGAVSSGNSLVGSTASDAVGNVNFRGRGVTGFGDGNYAIVSASWDSGSIADAGASTLARGSSGVTGPVNAANSVRGTAMSEGFNLSIAYDISRAQLAVGRRASNVVSLFTLSDVLFANGFE